jgi:hypothetical protein
MGSALRAAKTAALPATYRRHHPCHGHSRRCKAKTPRAALDLARLMAACIRVGPVLKTSRRASYAGSSAKIGGVEPGSLLLRLAILALPDQHVISSDEPMDAMRPPAACGVN